MAISLVGITLVQYFWIRHAIEVKEAQFDRSVNEVLSGVVKQLETDENVYFVTQQVWTGDDGHTVEYISYSDTSENDNVFIDESGLVNQIEVNAKTGGIIHVNSESNDIVTISSIGDKENRYQTIIKLDSLKES
jgi:two-component system phosphate regulon sensor histidine kinase PhoR